MEKQNFWIRGTNLDRQINFGFKRHESHLIETLRRDWENKLFFDVTLACRQGSLGAHRIVLCAFSTLLEQILTSSNRVSDMQEHPCIILNQKASRNPVIYFDEIDLMDLTTLVEFMYRGTLTVTHRRLPGLMKAATILKIRQPESRSEIDGRTRLSENLAASQNFNLGKSSSSVWVQPAVSSHQLKNSDSPLPSMEGRSWRKRTDVRPRIVWNKSQLLYLETIFNAGVCYPDLELCQMYAEELSQIPKSEGESHCYSTNSSKYVEVTYVNVRNWFQNKRYQSKQLAKKEQNKENVNPENDNPTNVQVECILGSSP